MNHRNARLLSEGVDLVQKLSNGTIHFSLFGLVNCYLFNMRHMEGLFAQICDK